MAYFFNKTAKHNSYYSYFYQAFEIFPFLVLTGCYANVAMAKISQTAFLKLIASDFFLHVFLVLLITV